MNFQVKIRGVGRGGGGQTLKLKMTFICTKNDVNHSTTLQQKRKLFVLSSILQLVDARTTCQRKVDICEAMLGKGHTSLSVSGIYSMVWYGMVWYGMVWYGMVWAIAPAGFPASPSFHPSTPPAQRHFLSVSKKNHYNTSNTYLFYVSLTKRGIIFIKDLYYLQMCTKDDGIFIQFVYFICNRPLGNIAIANSIFEYLKPQMLRFLR